MDARYQELARKESAYWGAVARDPQNPQIWDDPMLQEIFFGAEERHFLARAAACGSRVLELGCGEGDLARDLARHGLLVTAIDLSAERIAAARVQARASAIAGAGASDAAENPRFLAGDLNTMELPGGPFDLVIAHDALHHIVGLDALLERVERVLRPGGTLLVLDFVGMGRAARVLAAGLYAVLPTAAPYARKWGQRGALRSFLASERAKRNALARGGSALHDKSPFEGISQDSIVPAIAARFDIVERRPFLPFFWYLAPKLRVPRALRAPMARAFRAWDDALLKWGGRGAYVIVEARRREGGR